MIQPDPHIDELLAEGHVRLQKGYIDKGIILELAELVDARKRNPEWGYEELVLPWQQRAAIRNFFNHIDDTLNPGRNPRRRGRFSQLVHGGVGPRSRRISALRSHWATVFCGRCGRGLSAERSVRNGYGPVCILHITTEAFREEKQTMIATEALEA